MKTGFCIALIFGCVITAQADDPWTTPLSYNASPHTMAFTSRSYPNAMSDSVFAMAAFEDGRICMVSLFHYKARLFERWGVYLLVADPKGETYWATADIPESEISFDDDSLHVAFRENFIDGRDMRYRIVWSAGEISVDLNFENILPPWIQGDGRDVLGDPERSFQTRSVFSPWARVSGTIAVEGRETTVRGEGMGEKTIIVNRLSRFNPELLSMRVFGVTRDKQLTRGYHIGLLDSTSHSAFGSQRIPRLFVARDDAWLFATGDYSIEYGEIEPIPGLPFGYPSRFRLIAQTQGYRLDGVYESESLFNVTDIINELPRWLRGIVLVFVSRPVYFRMFGTFTGTLTHPDGEIEDIVLFGPYEYVVVR